LKAASDWGWLVHEKTLKESKAPVKVILVIGGMFFVLSIWSCLDFERKVVAVTQELDFCLLGKVS
jgi:hypothetical protein